MILEASQGENRDFTNTLFETLLHIPLPVSEERFTVFVGCWG